MKNHYKKHGLKKSGDGPGGKFNGPKVKHLIKEENLEELETMLPSEENIFVTYLRSIRELHKVCITSNFSLDEAEVALFNFEQNFYTLYQLFQLNMTLKIHVIIHHYLWYFEKTGKNFKETNGEFTETVHSSIKKWEQKKNFHVKRRLGSDHHLLRSFQSISSFNAVRMGSTPNKEMGKRRKTISESSESSPRSSPLLSSPRSSPTRGKGWNYRKSLYERFQLSALTLK